MATTSHAAQERAVEHGSTPEASVSRRLAHRLVDELLEGWVAEATHCLDDLLATYDRREQELIAR